MTANCNALDQRQAIGYLETDKDANVRLYLRGGFEAIAEQQVLGVPNWFKLLPRNPLVNRQEQATPKTARSVRRMPAEMPSWSLRHAARLADLLNASRNVPLEQRYLAA